MPAHSTEGTYGRVYHTYGHRHFSHPVYSSHRSRAHSVLSSSYDGRSSSASQSSHYDSRTRLRWILSLGLLLPALAAIIGVVAWAVSAEVVIGARRDSALKASDALRFPERLHDHEDFTIDRLDSRFTKIAHSQPQSQIVVDEVVPVKPESTIKVEKAGSDMKESLKTAIDNAIKESGLNSSSARNASVYFVSGTGLRGDAAAIGDALRENKSFRKSAGTQVAEVIDRLVAQRKNASKGSPHIVVVAPMKKNRASTTARPATRKAAVTSKPARHTTTTTSSSTTSTTTTSRPPATEEAQSLTQDADTLLAAAQMLAAHHKASFVRSDDHDEEEEEDEDEQRQYSSYNFGSESNRFESASLIGPTTFKPSQPIQSVPLLPPERPYIPPPPPSRPVQPVTQPQPHQKSQPQPQNNPHPHQHPQPQPHQQAPPQQRQFPQPANRMGPAPQHGQFVMPFRQPNGQPHMPPPPPLHGPHGFPPPLPQGPLQLHPRPNQESQQGRPQMHQQPQGMGPQFPNFPPHFVQQQSAPQGQYQPFQVPPQFHQQHQQHPGFPPPGQHGPFPGQNFPPPPENQFQGTAQASEDQENSGGDASGQLPTISFGNQGGHSNKNNAVVSLHAGDASSDGGGGPPAKGLTLHFGGGPIGGGGQIMTSPVGIFKTLLLPLLPKPRVNLNGKVVFGVVLEKGVGFGKQKHAPVQLRPSHLYHHG